jgi:hypothetical protein
VKHKVSKQDVVRVVATPDGNQMMQLLCPACKCMHTLLVRDDAAFARECCESATARDGGSFYYWTGDLTVPTINPSVYYRGPKKMVCHYSIGGGQISASVQSYLGNYNYTNCKSYYGPMVPVVDWNDVMAGRKPWPHN